jgi:hypothetical protein
MSPESKEELIKLTRQVAGRLLWRDFCDSKAFTDMIKEIAARKEKEN